MYKSRAIIVAVIIAAIGVFIVVTVSGFLHGGSKGYKNLPLPTAMEKTEKSSKGEHADSTKDNAVADVKQTAKDATDGAVEKAGKDEHADSTKDNAVADVKQTAKDATDGAVEKAGKDEHADSTKDNAVADVKQTAKDATDGAVEKAGKDEHADSTKDNAVADVKQTAKDATDGAVEKAGKDEHADSTKDNAVADVKQTAKDATDGAVEKAGKDEHADSTKDNAVADVKQTAKDATDDAVEKAGKDEHADSTKDNAVADVKQTAKDAADDAVEKAGQPITNIQVVTAEVIRYNPMVLVIQPGTTVAWENMNGHDTQSLPGLIPEGAEAWHSKLGDNFTRTFTKEGIYVYKCTPHFGLGMGGAIIVGKPVNLEAIRAAKVKGAAKRLVKKALKVADEM